LLVFGCAVVTVVEGHDALTLGREFLGVDAVELASAHALVDVNALALQVELDDRLLDETVAVDAGVRILVQAAVEHLKEFLGLVVGDVLELAVHDAFHHGLDVLALERPAQAAQLLQDDAERPDVRFQTLLLPLADFGAQVVGGADRSHGHVGGGVQTLGNAEVAQFDSAVLAHEHVRTLEVPVENLVFVQLVDRVDQLDEVVPDFVLGEVLVGGLLLFDQLAEVAPVGLLHPDQLLLLQLLGTLLVDDVGVRQPLQDLYLLQHAAFDFRVLHLDSLQGLLLLCVLFLD